MIDPVDLEKLRGDLLLRPLSPQAIRAAHALVRTGREFFNESCRELERCGLAKFSFLENSLRHVEADDPADTWFESTLLLEGLAEFGMMDMLDGGVP